MDISPAVQNVLPPQTVAASVGATTSIFFSLIQMLANKDYAISPPSYWPEDYGQYAKKHAMPVFDYIVVGAGSAGSIVAARLTENPDTTVLLIEAGGLPTHENVIPGLYLRTYQNPKTDWTFRAHSNRTCFGASGRQCYLPRGKGLGGSSGINFMLYVRGVKEDYEEWNNLAGPGWSYREVLPYFKKTEGNTNDSLVAYQDGKYHSAKGPLKIQSHEVTPLNYVTGKAFRDSGVKIIPETNADQVLGYTQLQSTSYMGRRSSVAEAFLHPNKDRPNLKVIINAYTRRVLIRDDTAYGVEFVYEGRRMRAYAKKEVIVSAGTIQSPPLLMRSGIGPREHLEEHGIPVKADLPVGYNYLDHLFVHLGFAFDSGFPPAKPTFEEDSLYDYLTETKGNYAAVPYLAGYEDTTNRTGVPNIQFFFTQYPRGIPDQSVRDFNIFTDFRDVLNPVEIEAKNHHDLSILTMSLIKAFSKGRITLPKKCHNCQEVDIDPNYLGEPQDEQALVDGIKEHIRLRQSPAFLAINTTFIRPELPECDVLTYQSDEYWRCYLKYLTTSGSHQTGTNSMGVVVDNRCRVYGIDRLRVVDASVIPVSIRGNTNAASMMVGERATDFIKEDNDEPFTLPDDFPANV